MELTPARQTARADLARHGVAVLYEDNHLLVLNKPAGLLSQGGPSGAPCVPTLVEAYRRVAEGKPGRVYVGLVHRLDRNASGVLAVARTSKAAARLSALLRERDPALVKEYLAWVSGRPPEASQVLTHWLRRTQGVTRLAAQGDDDARLARLEVQAQALGATTSRVGVRLHTGLAHQIRCQLALWGYPLIGDPKYGGPPFKRLALHAWRLCLPHPVGGATMEFQAPLPPELKALDAQFSPRVS